jgi:hypothetical protein
MGKKQEKITVSTDVLGMFANPQKVQMLYESAGFRCDLEVLAMPRQYLCLENLSRGCQVGFDLGGIHGKLVARPNLIRMDPTGAINSLKVTVADFLLPPVTRGGMLVETIASQLHKDIYINAHNVAVADNFGDYQTYGNFARFSHLTIENGVASGDISRTIDLIHKLQDGGAGKTTGIFDLVHAVLGMSGRRIDFVTVKKYWGKVIDQINNDFKYLHLPIGVNDDSLPIMEMIEEKTMLKDLDQRIREFNLGIILENQHNLLWGANQQMERERLVRIRAGLMECGLPV